MAKTDEGGTGLPGRAAMFFMLTLAWSWGFWGVLILTGYDWTSGVGVLLYALGGIGPLVAAATLVAKHPEPEAARRFWHRVFDARRISLAWWLVILGIAFLPNVIPHLVPGRGRVEIDRGFALVAMLLVAVLAGLAEEPGWRSVALDELEGALSALSAALLIGLVWTIWHVPLYLMEGTIQQEEGLWSIDFWVDMAARLPLALLYAWVVLNTNRSILAAILLHAAGNIGSVLIGPVGNAQIVMRLAIVTIMALLVVGLWKPDLVTRRDARQGTLHHRVT